MQQEKEENNLYIRNASKNDAVILPPGFWGVLRFNPMHWPLEIERFSLSPTIDIGLSWSAGMIIALHVLLIAVAVISPMA